MKTLTKALIGTGIVAGIGAMVLIPPTLAYGDRGDRGPKFGQSRHHGMAHRGIRLFERFDIDKDGAVTQSEIDRNRTDRVKRFDTDGDGKLSLKEYEALWLDAMRERMVDRFQRLDRDGDAAVTLEEFVSPMKSLVMWMDADEDGKITVQELKRMHGRRDRGGDHDRRHRDREDDRR